jgi:type IV pilus assembly protein PilA
MHTQRIQRQDGFTLIELLVVIMIIGILAAIAIPTLLGQRQKAQDADAKSQARNVVSLMEACYRGTDGYTGCWVDMQNPGASLPFGTTPGTVSVVNEQPQGYQIVAISKAHTGGVNHTFSINYNFGGLPSRTCAPVGVGGCTASGSW